jgi:hypothetical protein
MTCPGTKEDKQKKERLMTSSDAAATTVVVLFSGTLTHAESSGMHLDAIKFRQPVRLSSFDSQ